MADHEIDFAPGSLVRLKSGSPLMTVGHTWIDDRSEGTGKRYAKVSYHNPVSGQVEKQTIAVSLLKAG